MATDAIGTGLPWVEAIADSFVPYSFIAFHTDELPRLAKARENLVAADLQGAPAVGFRIADGTAFTWQIKENRVVATPGSAGADTLIELSAATFSEYLHELLSASGAVRTGRATVVRGDLTAWQRWEPATRSLMSGRPIYGPHVRETLVDRAGEPLDLHQTFRPGDDREEMRHFLAAAGYLHIKGVFTPEEVDRYATRSSTSGR